MLRETPLHTGRVSSLVHPCAHLECAWFHFRRKVTLFKGTALAGKTVGRSLFELGTYESSMDQLWADGTMTQVRECSAALRVHSSMHIKFIIFTFAARDANRLRLVNIPVRDAHTAVYNVFSATRLFWREYCVHVSNREQICRALRSVVHWGNGGPPDRSPVCVRRYTSSGQGNIWTA